MTPTALPACLWFLFALSAAIYLSLAACRTNVSLRPLRLGWFAAATVLGRVTLLFVSWIEWWEWLPIASCLIAVAVASWFQFIWLVRAEDDEFRRRLYDACRGLRLEYRESAPDSLDLVERQRHHRLCVADLGRGWVLVRLPRAVRHSKVALLVDWLAKQYPGPVPRIHICLSGDR
jgi:hypothetical protein